MGSCQACGRPVYEVSGSCAVCQRWLLNVTTWLYRRRLGFLFGDRAQLRGIRQEPCVPRLRGR